MYDVVVVGGGPAGLAAAQAVSTTGLRCVVLERNAAFGEPVRTSGGSFTAPLRALGVPARLWHPVTRLRVTGPRHDLRWRYRRPRMCILDVRGLYQWLAARAATAGAELRLKQHVTAAIVESGVLRGVTVRGGGEFRARLVIDATGATGVIARAAGLRDSSTRTAAGVEMEVFAPRYDQREALLVVGDDIAPGGYGWAFPRGDGRVRLGIGVIRPDSDADVQALLDGFVRRVDSLRESCSGAQPLELHAGVMPVFAHGAVASVGPGVMVVGDAAGHGSTLLGEGIRHAIVSGKMAGTVAAQALSGSGDPSVTVLQAYPRRWDALVGRQMRIGHAINVRISAYRDEDWSRALDVVGRMSPRLVLTALAGELTPGFALRLALRHPLLAAGQGRRFLRAACGRLG